MLQYDWDARRQLVRERAADLATDYEVSRPPPTRRLRRTAFGAGWPGAVFGALERPSPEQMTDPRVGTTAHGS